MDSSAASDTERGTALETDLGSETVTPISLSPSPSTLTVGRPRQSSVWNLFVYNSTTHKSVCHVPVSSSEASVSPTVCGHIVSGKNTTNLKNHLKAKHYAHFKEMLDEDTLKATEIRGKAKKRSFGHQRTLGEVVQKKYDKASGRWQHITRKVAIFVASTNVPNSIVENDEFRMMVETLDSRYQVPGRARLGREIDKVLVDMKEKIQGYLDQARNVNICTDIWTKRGMTSSYLGITAHFFTKYDHRRHHATLAVRTMPHPHTAENIKEILEGVLDEWHIPLNKLNVVVTDNGSNMVKAFKHQISKSTDGEPEDEEEEKDVEDLDIEKQELECDKDLEDFEDKELDHDITFKYSGCKRLSCFAHTLQLVVQKFRSSDFKQLMTKVHKLVNKVNKSSKATEMLISLCNRKLVKDVPTRWSSTYLLIDRLLSVRDPLSSVLESQQWDNLALSEWRTLENIHQLLKPFAQYTSLIQGEEYTTLNCVLPILLELNLHLSEMIKLPYSDIVRVASSLRSELELRFRKFTDPQDEAYDPIFVIATFLDPTWHKVLNPIQVESGKRELLTLLKNNGSSSASSIHSQSSREEEDPAEPPKKHVRFSRLSKVLEEKLKQGVEKAAKRPVGEMEITQYIEKLQYAEKEHLHTF